MQAWLIDSLGGIDKLHLGDAPDPKAGAGEVVLDVLYAALNPADRYLAEGQYPARPALPHILGRDAVGIVREVGVNVSDLKPGDTRVVLRGETGVNKPGTLAERVAVAADYLVEPPAGWTLEEAGCAALVYITAYQALTMWGPLPSPAVVLVTGASGGVGVATTQLAAAMGHHVIALSRSDEKQKVLVDLGANFALSPEQPDWKRAVKRNADALGKRVDLAVDNIGGQTFNDVLDTLADQGRISCVGRLAGPVPNFNTASLFFRRLRIGGVHVGSYTNAESRAAWAKIVGILHARNAKPLVDRVFDFDQVPHAFVRLAEGPMGKVVVRVRGT